MREQDSKDNRYKAPDLKDLFESKKYAGLPEVLDRPEPFLMRKLTPLLSSKVYIDDAGIEAIKRSLEKGPVIYALKYRDLYDIHFLRWFFRKKGLPEPNFAFAIPSRFHMSASKTWEVLRGRFRKNRSNGPLEENPISEALSSILRAGGSGVFFLVDEKTSRQRYVHPETDPLETILEIQGRIQGAISIVPIFVMYDRRPKRVVRPFWEIFFGETDKPGPMYRIVNAMRKWILPELLVGRPMNLLEHMEEFGGDIPWEDAPRIFRERLTASINDRIRVSRGPERLSRTEIKEKTLRDPKVRLAVKQMVEDQGMRPEKARGMAEAYVDEIAADQKMFMLRLWYTIIYYLINKLFEKTDVRESDFEMIKREAQTGSLIFVPCHKSHIDYLINLYFLFIKQVMPPLTAAGSNLNFWPIGPMLQYTAAFYIRRSFKGLNLYKKVFEVYLKGLVEEKYNIQFFIEGGRSRTGKLLEPKLGFLSFLLQTVDRGEVDDLRFIPLYIGYDHVLEEKSFLSELSGKEKEKETIWGVIRARKFFKARYGAIYMRFHEPISYRKFCNHLLDQQPEDLSTSQSRKVLEPFGRYIMAGIVKSAVVTALELTAASMVCFCKSSISLDEIKKAFHYLHKVLQSMEVEFADNLSDPNQAIDNSISKFINKGLITKIDNSSEDQGIIYEIDSQNWASLQFYQNALVNFLWPSSFAALIILSQLRKATEAMEKKEILERFKFANEIMFKEIVVNPLIKLEDSFEETWRYFVNQEWILENGEISETGDTALRSLAGVTIDLWQTYLKVTDIAEENQSTPVSVKDFSKRMTQNLNKTHKDLSKEIKAAPMNSVTVKNALLRLRELGAIKYKPTKKSYEGVADMDKFSNINNFIREMISHMIIVPDAPPCIWPLEK